MNRREKLRRENTSITWYGKAKSKHKLKKDERKTKKMKKKITLV
jgi:hypothetical protein